MDTNRLKRFATEARNILMQGVVHRLSALGFLPDGSVTEEPQQQGGGATFMGDTVTQDFYDKWQSLRRAVTERGINEVAEEAAYTWFNRLVAIRILVKNGLASPVLEYESEDVLVPLLVSEARQGRMPEMGADSLRNITDLLDDDSKTSEQFALLIVAYCHENPIINKCFGRISDYTELLLPTNILNEGGFVYLLNHTEFISEEDYRSPELIGWLYQFYISEKKDDVFASFKKGKKAEAKDIPAATQIFTPNWIVKYMVQNTVGRIYLDNNPYEEDIQKNWQYLVESAEKPSADSILKYDELTDLRVADLACGSGHILNECFDLLYDLYIAEGYGRGKAIENIFRHNLTGIDLDTRAKQLAQFALLLKACQKDAAFADGHCLPNVLDMPDHEDSLNHFFGVFMHDMDAHSSTLLKAVKLCNQSHDLGSIMKFDITEQDRKDLLFCIERWEQEHEIHKLNNDVNDVAIAKLILALTEKYHALVMNPPYMGSGNMNATLSKYVKDEYEEGKADLATVFVQMMAKRTIKNGSYAFIIPPSWMFLSTFEKLRKNIIENNSIQSLLHLSRGVFGADFGASSAVIQNTGNKEARGTYFRLVERTFQEFEQSHLRMLFEQTLANHDFKYRFKDYTKDVTELPFSEEGKKIYYPNVNQQDFEKIPGCLIGYNLSDNILSLFSDFPNLDQDGNMFRIGLMTGDNKRFLRLWHEVSIYNTFFDCKSPDESMKSSKIWYPINSGGAFRKWYGNQTTIANWLHDGKEMKEDAVRRNNGSHWSRYIVGVDKYFHEGISWNAISSGKICLRYFGEGFLIGHSSVCGFCNKNNYVMALLNSPVSTSILQILSPTVNYGSTQVNKLPIIYKSESIIECTVLQNISISKQDWDAHETSWDFERNPLYGQFLECMEDDLQNVIPSGASLDEISKYAVPEAMHPLTTCMQNYKDKWEVNFMRLHENEEELNRQFIDIYGLQSELSPDVPLDEITILQQGEISIENDQIKWHDDVIIKQFISYALGCMMGRYSIDKPGLILANQGDGVNEYHEKVPNSRFEVDDDGIIPLMASDTDFFDNATLRFKQWLTVALGDTHLVENLNFIEGALGKSLDDYFVKDFWKDHKKMYQNRPIYWLFSSKKGAFQCIAYMHRMNAYTAERIRTKYLLPHIEWLLQKQSEMEENAANLTTAERRKLDNIRKQIEECREYHDRLHVVADEQIAFDLDDGVVVNYAKFGDVLSKLK